MILDKEETGKLWTDIRYRLERLRKGEEGAFTFYLLELDIKKLGAPLWILGTSKKELRKFRVQGLKNNVQHRLIMLRAGMSCTFTLELLTDDIKELNLPLSNLGIKKGELKKYARGRL